MWVRRKCGGLIFRSPLLQPPSATIQWHGPGIFHLSKSTRPFPIPQGQVPFPVYCTANQHIMMRPFGFRRIQPCQGNIPMNVTRPSYKAWDAASIASVSNSSFQVRSFTEDRDEHHSHNFHSSTSNSSMTQSTMLSHSVNQTTLYPGGIV